MSFKQYKTPYLADRKLCSGCTACANVCPANCIEMKPDKYGFLYPVINKKSCLHCGMCSKTCPVLNEIGFQTTPKTYAAYTRDERLRMHSSSGGVFSEIAKCFISEGGIVYGAAYDQDFNVFHCAADCYEKLNLLQGAKYSESKLGATFKSIKTSLDSGYKVLFSGTPCQVSGLKSFLAKDYKNLVCVDFVCHGVPSPLVWSTYVKYRAKVDNGNTPPIEINYRDKCSGWSNYQYSNSFKYANGNVYTIVSTQDVFMNLFINNYILRLSCGDCKFKGYNRISDITLGDFWGVWEIAPEMDDNKGTSVVLIQSSKGNDIWDQIKKRVVFKEISLEDASKFNVSLLNSSELSGKRKAVLENVRINGVDSFNDSHSARSKLKCLIQKVQAYFKENKI